MTTEAPPRSLEELIERARLRSGIAPEERLAKARERYAETDRRLRILFKSLEVTEELLNRRISL